MRNIRKIKLKSGHAYEVQIRKVGHPHVCQRFRLRSEAVSWKNKTESDMDSGIYQDPRAAKTKTLKDCIDRYEVEVTSHKKSAIKERSLLRLWKDEHQDDKPGLALRTMASLKASEFAALRDRWLQMLEPATVVRRLALISNVYTRAIKDWGMTSLTNPVQSISKPSIRNARSRRVESANPEGEVFRDVQDDEVTRIIAESKSKYLAPLIQLALETAARRGELVNLKWAHVDLIKRFVVFVDTKNGEDRKVPLSDAALEVLQKLPRSIATSSVFYISEDAVTRAFSRARDRARVTYEIACRDAGDKPSPTFLIDISFHDLRHEATSRLALKDMPIHILAAITGHKDSRMLQRYYNPKVSELAKWFTKTEA